MKIMQRTAYSRMSVKGERVPFCYAYSLSGARNYSHAALVENLFGFSCSFKGDQVWSSGLARAMSSR